MYGEFMHSHGPGVRHSHENYGVHGHPLPLDQSYDFVYAQDQPAFEKGIYHRIYSYGLWPVAVAWFIAGTMATLLLVMAPLEASEEVVNVGSPLGGLAAAAAYWRVRRNVDGVIIPVDGQSEYVYGPEAMFEARGMPS